MCVMRCTAVASFIYISNGQELRDHFEGRARSMDTRRARVREMGPTSSVGVATLPIMHPDETGSARGLVGPGVGFPPARRHFSNNPLFMASFPAAAPFSPNGTAAQRARWAGNLVIYLQWKSCNGIVSSLVHPSDGASGEKVKFE